MHDCSTFQTPTLGYVFSPPLLQRIQKVAKLLLVRIILLSALRPRSLLVKLLCRRLAEAEAKAKVEAEVKDRLQRNAAS